MKQGTSSGLESKLEGYNKSLAIGQLGGLAATYAGVTQTEFLSRYIPSVSGLASSSAGLIGLGMISNFIGDQLGFAASLYAYNKDKYKGISGKLKFLKDGFELGTRHLGSYLISFPLAAAASYAAMATGILSGAAAVIAPYLIESAVTGFGYLFSTKKYREKTPDASPH